MPSTKEVLASLAARSPHGRATDYGKPERLGFVMATVKDANDSLGFEDIHSFSFLYHQALSSTYVLQEVL